MVCIDIHAIFWHAHGIAIGDRRHGTHAQPQLPLYFFGASY